jgi:FdrA protein
MKKILIEKSTYLDSVSLMRVSKKAADAAGIGSAMVAMATDTNLLLLKEAGFDPGDAAGASANDLIIALDAADEVSLEGALGLIRQEIEGGAAPAEEGEYTPRSLDGALKSHPDLNLVFISVPGKFAAGEAQMALAAGRHVMIFSDNVSVDEEVKLKALGRAGGLLVMGPDCGTAIINGVGLGFANAVPRGNVGIVSASGTGAQEVSSVLARLGAGISQLIGTGGRDVSESVGGATTILGLKALSADEKTDVIVIISKVPDEATGRDILGIARQSDKPCVIWFAGQDAKPGEDNLIYAGTLADTAREAAKAAGVISEIPPADDAAGIAHNLGDGLAPGRKFVRGLFGGGTLGQEAVFLLGSSLGEISTNMKLPGTSLLEDPSRSAGHTVVDLGDDTFTRGRAHPMIDQSYKLARIAKEFEDPETAVILLDVVLGYGCNMDPGGEIAGALTKLREKHGPTAGPKVVVGLCGTYDDPQDYAGQKRKLESAGAIVTETNELACGLVARIIGGQHG